MSAKEANKQVFSWLKRQAKKMDLTATILDDQARRNGRYLHVPVDLPEKTDLSDLVSALQDLEDAWNDRQPPRCVWS